MSTKRIDFIKKQLDEKGVKGISNIKDSGKGLIVNYGTGVSTYYRWAHFTDDNIIKDIIANSKGLGREWNIQEAKAKLCNTLYNKGYTADHFDGISNELHIIKESTGEQMKYKINFGSMKNWKQLEKTVKDIITAFEFGYAFPNYDEIYVQVTKVPMATYTSYFDLAYIKVWDDDEKRCYYIYYYRKSGNGARIYLRKDEVKGHEVEIAEKIKAGMKGNYIITRHKGTQFLVTSTIGESAASILFEKDVVETLFGKNPMVAFVNNGVVIKRADK